MEHRITLGCDPEFELCDGKRVVEASQYMSHRMNARVGVDGGYDAAELRPAPGKTSVDLVKNLKKLFKRFKGDYPGFALSVQGNTYAVGGHLHFGAPEGAAHEPELILLRLFDTAIGKLAKAKDGIARKRDGWGKLSEARTKTYGFEYRTPSAAIFRKPEYVEVITRLLQAVYSCYLDQRKELLMSDNSINYGKFVAEIKKQVLDEKDIKVLKEFAKYKPTGEDIVKYWV